ncbi:MAG: protein phosphatase 2C domain-containing protein [Planctomycetota bacterium]|nr:protein phosphatase 2C domain-containing protein [Planctomycetota bacterium]
MAGTSAGDRILLLGQDEARYGAFRSETLDGGRVACCLSVGADPETPAGAFKGNPDVPNEDALLVIAHEDRVLLAVADGHYGTYASHTLLQRLQDTVEAPPASPAALARLLREVARPEPGAPPRAATTLLAVVIRYDIRAGFGYSFGDSTCLVLGGPRSGQPLHRHTDAYVTPQVRESLASERAAFFELDLPEGGLLAAFTDGIDECHYRQPATSLGTDQFNGLYEQSGPDPARYADALAQAALDGVSGSPGGQDNLALVVVGG